MYTFSILAMDFAFLQGVSAMFIEEKYVETTICGLGVLTAAGVSYHTNPGDRIYMHCVCHPDGLQTPPGHTKGHILGFLFFLCLISFPTMRNLVR